MIEVLTPGIYSSIQDGGRTGFREFGVPCSGFMDESSAHVANLLLGNPPDAPLIETAQAGLRLKFHKPAHVVCCGAEAQAQINERPVQMNRVNPIRSGDVFWIGSIAKGVWTYIGIVGEFLLDPVMNSFSQHNGITSSVKLSKDTRIFFRTYKSVNAQNARIRFREEHFIKNEIEVFKGPEFDLLSESDKRGIIENYYSVSNQSNRMAFHFNEKLSAHEYSILTSPVLPGTIQWTPSGNLFCLMRDAQTTGGYPRILQLSRESISILSQKQPKELFKLQMRT
jgi:antagonist of KipI